MTLVEQVPVSLGRRSYEILVGEGLIESAGERLLPFLRQKRTIIVTDRNVAGFHLSALERSLAAAGIAFQSIILPPGEQTKDFAHYARLAEDILSLGIERGTILLAFGGGVIGDLAGFTAATLLRGIDFVQIPTTLLAQVDSSVGGKTGIDTPQGKNLVGAFHQPRLVLADIRVLETLEPRQLRAGYAEVVKYGLIRDRDFFLWLEEFGPALLAGDRAARRMAVVESCRAKAAVVAADERESGDRALLNLGHTFGHALESATGFSDSLLHGEAVAIGMCLAFDLSARLGLCPPEDAERTRRHLAVCGLPTDRAFLGGEPIPADILLGHMQKDKKVKDGRITLILARGIGQAFTTGEVEPALLHRFLDAGRID
jgi:3-dehydroquinate synthase